MTRPPARERNSTGAYLGRLEQCLLLCACLVVLPVQTTICDPAGITTVCKGGHSVFPSDKIPKYVVDLDLSRNELTLIQENTLHDFSEIRILNMSRNLITNIHSKAFFLLTVMESLDLSFNCLKEISDDILYNNAKLKWFSVAHNVELKSIPLLQSKSLQIFNVSNCSIQSMNETTFQEVESIEVLDLSFNKLSDVRYHTFDAFTSLQYLDISNNNLQHMDFINSDCALSLTYLDISTNHISDLDIKTFKILLSLRKIHFHNNPWNCTDNMKTVYENMLKGELTLNLNCISSTYREAISWHEWYYTVYNVVNQDTSSSYITSTETSNQITLQNCTKVESKCSGVSYALAIVSTINIIIIIGLFIFNMKRPTPVAQ